MTISPPESGEKDKKILESPVKADPRPIDFAKLDKPGFWSSKLSKVLDQKPGLSNLAKSIGLGSAFTGAVSYTHLTLPTMFEV